MNPTLSGKVTRTYVSSATFCAGVIETTDSGRARFRAPFPLPEGEYLTLSGTWKTDPKYGRQFVVKSIVFEIPATDEGLATYLASHPAFKGVGPAIAERLVQDAGGAGEFDRWIRQDLADLEPQSRLSKRVLSQVREAWIANSSSNATRAYLATFGLTPHQMDTLIETYGESVIPVLRENPYVLVRHVANYGFKRVDKIALAMGVRKDHPQRIEAALSHTLAEQTGLGHTWTDSSSLVEWTLDLLALDDLDARTQIRAVAQEMLRDERIAAEGSAVTTPYYLSCETELRAAFESHAWSLVQGRQGLDDTAGLRPLQAEAYRMAIARRISVITGPAGTGKSVVVARIAKSLRGLGLSLALCAPTGKATQRIEQSLREQGESQEAKTVHRLLEYDGREYQRVSLSGGMDHFDVVVMDEASMADVPLLTEVVKRIDFSRTQLILVGDHNQLPPVGPGNVLRDLVRYRLVPVVELTEVMRQAGVLKANCASVLQGQLKPTAEGDSGWTVIDSFKEPLEIQAYLRDLVLDRIPKRLGLDPVHDVQLLTPTHIGPLGTKDLNRLMQQWIHGPVDGRFTVGDKVIQCQNDYELGVMNGTLGFVEGIELGKQPTYVIQFEGVGVKQVSGEQLANVRLAYAITAHRAQGSEFPCAVVLCHKAHYFADRNWLYTAVTRARGHCIVVGDRWGLRSAVKKNMAVARRTLLSLWAERSNGNLVRCRSA